MIDRELRHGMSFRAASAAECQGSPQCTTLGGRGQESGLLLWVVFCGEGQGTAYQQ